MNQYKSSAQLKDLAKEKLSGCYGTTIAALFLAGSINYLLTELLTGSRPVNTPQDYIIYSLASGLVSVLLGVLQTGTAFLYLNIACDQPHRVNDIFYGIFNHPGCSIVVALANTLVSLLCLTPGQVFSQLFLGTQNPTYMMLTFVSFGIGLLIYVPVNLAISQSYYLLLDFPEYTGKQALSASWNLMKGHKGRLFYIQASFLPLIFLGILSMGLGLFWLLPYMNMTYALFFLDIMKPDKSETL